MIGFTGAGLDRADHLRLEEGRIWEMRRSPEARILRLDGMMPVLEGDGRVAWDRPGEGGDHIFLGLDDGAPRFAPLLKPEPGLNPWGIFQIVGDMAPEDAALWGATYSLIQWHSRHGHCANCGSPTHLFRVGWGRLCPVCKAEHYPRVDPVVIMLAEHDGRVLVGRQPRYPAGRYSALAGYVEPGESMEEAVARELEEEAGILVDNVRYVASQPWPLSGALMIACTAEARSDALRIDPRELEDAMWVTRDDVRDAVEGREGARFLAPTPIAIASSLLRHWLAAEAPAA